MGSQTKNWTSRLGFVLATSGSAVGLGNIWKFPYVAGTNGGGAWIAVYLLFILAVALPILLAEVLIGQQGRSGPVGSFRELAGKNTPWQAVGFVGVVSSTFILAFYSVVGGWVLNFLYLAATNSFENQNHDAIQSLFTNLTSNTPQLLFWQFVFLGLTLGVSIAGVDKGIERLNKIAMPSLLGILVLMLAYMALGTGFGKAVDFLFSADTSKLTPEAIRDALGHAAFTLSIGTCVIMCYGSYLPKETNVLGLCLSVAIIDTIAAILSSLVIFSIVFSSGLDIAAGPGLMFITLPTIFAKIPFGFFIGLVFFFLIFFASITSSVSMLEPAIGFFQNNLNRSRSSASLLSGLIVLCLGVLPCLSFTIFSDIKIFGLNFFDLFDKLVSIYLMPLGGIFISLFFGWIMGKNAVEKVCPNSPKMQIGLLWTTRIIAPTGVFLVMLDQLLN